MLSSVQTIQVLAMYVTDKLSVACAVSKHLEECDVSTTSIVNGTTTIRNVQKVNTTYVATR